MSYLLRVRTRDRARVRIRPRVRVRVRARGQGQGQGQGSTGHTSLHVRDELGGCRVDDHGVVRDCIRQWPARTRE
eukprot:scaffold16262_cov59-Phaeocystis_antarctica.AAC.1